MKYMYITIYRHGSGHNYYGNDYDDDDDVVNSNNKSNNNCGNLNTIKM